MITVMSECNFCDTKKPIVWEDVDGKKMCEDRVKQFPTNPIEWDE